jgi:hypothetical protein
MVVKISMQQYCQIWPGWGDEMGVMMELWDHLKDRSWDGLSEDRVEDINKFLSDEDKKSLVRTEAAFKALNWDMV